MPIVSPGESCLDWYGKPEDGGFAEDVPSEPLACHMLS